ncbi:hypothetical protein RFI_12030, partial [Reticulomyxa filosa]
MEKLLDEEMKEETTEAKRTNENASADANASEDKEKKTWTPLITKEKEKEEEEEDKGKKAGVDREERRYQMQVSLISELQKVDNEYMTDLLPYFYNVLEDEDNERRVAAVKMFCQMFSAPGNKIELNKEWSSIFSLFLKRFDDKEPQGKRKVMCEHLEKLILNQSGAYMQELLEHLVTRSKDFDENVRHVVVKSMVHIGLTNEAVVDHHVIDALVRRVVDTKASIRLDAIGGCCSWFAKHVASFWKANSPLPKKNKVLFFLIKYMYIYIYVHIFVYLLMTYKCNELIRIKVEKLFEENVMRGADDKSKRKEEEKTNKTVGKKSKGGDADFVSRVNVLLGIMSLLSESEKKVWMQFFATSKKELAGTVLQLVKNYEHIRAIEGHKNPSAKGAGVAPLVHPSKKRETVALLQQQIKALLQHFDTKFDLVGSTTKKNKFRNNETCF